MQYVKIQSKDIETTVPTKDTFTSANELNLLDSGWSIMMGDCNNTFDNCTTTFSNYLDISPDDLKNMYKYNKSKIGFRYSPYMILVPGGEDGNSVTALYIDNFPITKVQPFYDNDTTLDKEYIFYGHLFFAGKLLTFRMQHKPNSSETSTKYYYMFQFKEISVDVSTATE